MNNPLRWGTDTNAQVKPPAAKRNAGHQPGRPEAAQYENWWKDLTARCMERVAMAFMAVENDPPNMAVRVLPGAILNGSALTEVAEQTVGAIAAPAVNPRVDLIFIDRVTGMAGVATGAESTSPSAPAVPVGKTPVCLVHLTVGQASIANQALIDLRVLYGFNPPVAVPTTDTLVSMGTSGALATVAAPATTSLLQQTAAGALSWETTLPSGLTLPGPTISEPTITGGGSLDGSFSGTPTFTGQYTYFEGEARFQGNARFSSDAFLTESWAFEITLTSTAMTIDANTKIFVRYNGTGGHTISLTSINFIGRRLYFICNDGSGTAITIDPAGSETINGAATVTLSVGARMILWCTGYGWKAILQ